MLGESEIKLKIEQGALRLHTVIEIVGTPREHVEETLRIVLKRLRDEKGVDVIGGKVHEPREQAAFFSTFAELDILVKDFITLAGFLFNYMPSSIELVAPASVKVTALEVSGLFNDLAGRLHETDMRLKNVNAANILLDRNIATLLKNAVILALGSGSRTIGDISTKLGIPEQQLGPFLEQYVREKMVRKDGHSYSLAPKK